MNRAPLDRFHSPLCKKGALIDLKLRDPKNRKELTSHSQHSEIFSVDPWNPFQYLKHNLSPDGQYQSKKSPKGRSPTTLEFQSINSENTSNSLEEHSVPLSKSDSTNPKSTVPEYRRSALEKEIRNLQSINSPGALESDLILNETRTRGPSHQKARPIYDEALTLNMPRGSGGKFTLHFRKKMILKNDGQNFKKKF